MYGTGLGAELRRLLDRTGRVLARLRCFLGPHDFGQWDTGLPPDFVGRSPRGYFQYRGCHRCGIIKERMIW